MSSVSVAAATDTSTDKLPTTKLAISGYGGSDSSEGRVTDQGVGTAKVVALAEISASTSPAQVVIIKAEPCDGTGAIVQNGVALSATVKSVTMSSSGEAIENGGNTTAMDTLESGVAKLAINGTNQNRMIRVSPINSWLLIYLHVALIHERYIY